MSLGELLILIPALTAAIVSVINALKSKARDEKVDAVKHELVSRDDIANGKLDQIHTLTNSSMDALKAKLAVALERIERLEDLLAKATALKGIA